MKKLVIVLGFIVALVTVVFSCQAQEYHGNGVMIGKAARLVLPDSAQFGEANGSFYYNNTSNRFRFRENGIWRGLGGGGSSLDSTNFWRTKSNFSIFNGVGAPFNRMRATIEADRLEFFLPASSGNSFNVVDETNFGGLTINEGGTFFLSDGTGDRIGSNGTGTAMSIESQDSIRLEGKAFYDIGDIPPLNNDGQLITFGQANDSYWRTSANTNLDNIRLLIQNSPISGVKTQFNIANPANPNPGSYFRLIDVDVANFTSAEIKLQDYSVETGGGILPSGLAARLNGFVTNTNEAQLVAHQNGNLYAGKTQASSPNTRFGALMYINNYHNNWQDGDNNGTIIRARVVPDIGFIEDSLIANAWLTDQDFTITDTNNVGTFQDTLKLVSNGVDRIALFDNDEAGTQFRNPSGNVLMVLDSPNPSAPNYGHLLLTQSQNTDSVTIQFGVPAPNNDGLLTYRRTTGGVLSHFTFRGGASFTDQVQVRFGDPVEGQDGATKRYVDGYDTGSLTDGAPTDAEITAIVGAANSAQNGAGRKRTIKDTDGSGLVYVVISDGTNWYYFTGTLAS